MTFQVSKPTAEQQRDHQDNVIELNGKGMWDPSEHNDIPGPLELFRASAIQEYAAMDGSTKEEPPIQEQVMESKKKGCNNLEESSKGIQVLPQ